MKRALIQLSFYASFVMFVVCFFGGLGGMIYALIVHDRNMAYFFQIFAVGSIFMGKTALLMDKLRST